MDARPTSPKQGRGGRKELVTDSLQVNLIKGREQRAERRSVKTSKDIPEIGNLIRGRNPETWRTWRTTTRGEGPMSPDRDAFSDGDRHILKEGRGDGICPMAAFSHFSPALTMGFARRSPITCRELPSKMRDLFWNDEFVFRSESF